MLDDAALDDPGLDDAGLDDPRADGAGPDAPPPAPPGDGLPWDRCSAPEVLRPSQAAVLDELDARRAAGTSRTNVVLPAGAGKTLLGLEAARRAGRRTLVLVPSTAVQGQWLRAWAGFGGAGRHPLPASADPRLTAAVTVLTFSALTAWDRGADDEDVADDTGAAVAERRRAAVRGVPGADLLSLLHAGGRAVVSRAATAGPWTLVLDESAHLLETWGLLLPALVDALGADTAVLGLSATPARDLGERAREVHDRLFGTADGRAADVEVPLPLAVVRGEVAPSRELVHLSRPTPQEDAELAGDRARFAELRDELLHRRAGSLPFPDWLWRRLHERRLPDATAQRCWRELEQGEPALARAGLRAVHAGLLGLPAGARLQEEHRVPADAQDWAVLLGTYALEQLRDSPAGQDARLLGEITQVLPALGSSLTGRGLRTATSPVDRVCALSAAKAVGARRVLAEELAVRGADLRALVLCDFEQRTAPAQGVRADRGTLTPGSAGAVFAALARGELAGVLRPVLCTGRTVALRREDLAAFRAFAPHRLADRLVAEPFAGQRSLVTVTTGEGWRAATWVPLVTDWLTSGGTSAVVGTRGLLGEGWDCPALDVVVDLTTAAGTASAASVRGRALRRDPARPGKVAHTWTVVCVADDHPRGGVDHLRAVRSHETCLSLAPDGAVEVGVGHLDEALSPYAPPAPEVRDAVNARSLARVADDAGARAAWAAAGEDGTEQAVLRVRAGRPLGLPAGVVPPALLQVTRTLGSPAPAPLPRTPRRVRLWPLPVAAAVVASSAGTVAASAVVGAGSGLLTGVLLGGGVAGRRWASQSRALHRAPQDSSAAVLGSLACAVAEALHATGRTSRGASAVRVSRRADGDVELRLEAPTDESVRFARCVDELLAPLAEPRWLVSRLVLPVPEGPAATRRLALARAVGRPVDAAVTWHAVPADLSRTRAHVDAFDAAWQRHLGAGRLVLGTDPEGSALVELLRGEDPFALTTRLRTVWAPLASRE